MSMRVIGLTGQTGAGKSTMCMALREVGLQVIDCDQVSREVTAPGEPCLQALADCFGREILCQDGSLNRRQLGARVFADEAERHRLEQIIFPFIIDALGQRIQALERAGVPGVVLDAPTLYESGVDRMCHTVVAVVADPALRLARILQRDGLSEQAARARMSAQQPDSFYTDRADVVLVNDGAPARFQAQALRWAHSIFPERS